MGRTVAIEDLAGFGVGSALGSRVQQQAVVQLPLAEQDLQSRFRCHKKPLQMYAKPLHMSRNVSGQVMEEAENVSGAAPPPGTGSAKPLQMS